MSYSEQLLDAIEQHDFSQDKILLKKALENDQPEMLSSLAENLTNYGFTDLSKEVYRFLIGKFPQEDLFKVYLAEILLNDGKEDDGLTLLYNVKPTSSAYLEALLVQADYYQTNGFIETAKDKLLAALKLAPNEAAIKFGLAELEYNSGQYELALPIYESLAKTGASFGEVNFKQRLFQVEAKLGNYEKASQIIKENEDILFDIDSKYQAGLVMLAVKDDDRTIKFLEEVIDQSPDYVNAYPLLAQSYAHKKDFDQVLRIAQIGLAYNELDETLYSLGSQAAIKIGDNEAAEDLLKKGLKVAPENSDLRLQLSNLFLQEGQDSDNLSLFSRMDDEEIEPQAHWNMAVSYDRLDQTEKAKSEYLSAYQEMKENPEFLKQLIFFFKQLEDSHDIVKQLLSRYLKLVPDDEDMQNLANQLGE